ncbi:MAG TPA: YesL family protein [Lachnospiraceae bacterium]|nr:YesL family protein [Lachnospiraceae bacterium]
MERKNMGQLFDLDNPLMRGLGKIADLIWLNLLTVLCCIPIITAGASITSLYYVTMKMVKDEEGYITRSFFKAFKENFKKSTLIWIIFLIGFCVIAGDIWIMQNKDQKFDRYLKYPVGFLAIILIFILLYVFPLQARFENTIKNTIKNSLILSISHLHFTVGLIIIQIIPWVAFYFLQNAAVLIVILLGFSGVAYLSSYAYVTIFSKLEVEEKGTVVEEKWDLMD